MNSVLRWYAYRKYCSSKHDKGHHILYRNAMIRILILLMLESFIIVGLQHYIRSKSEAFTNKLSKTKKEQDAISRNMKYFPIPNQYLERIRFTDTYGAKRQNGIHEGCDLMDQKNVAGEIPVVSVSDGVITNIGWLYFGGYRIGITSNAGVYYYYAHLDSYAQGLEPGREVIAGQFLGFMGNTGEGEEGTKGQFDVHLHFGIYINEGEDEKSINPYPYLSHQSGCTNRYIIVR